MASSNGWHVSTLSTGPLRIKFNEVWMSSAPQCVPAYKIAGMRYTCKCRLILLVPWWRHQMETFSALLALCEGNSPVTGEFPSQRPVTRSLDVFFDLNLNKRLNKQSRRRWFEMSSRSLWWHRNATCIESKSRTKWKPFEQTLLATGEKYFVVGRQLEFLVRYIYFVQC